MAGTDASRAPGPDDGGSAATIVPLVWTPIAFGRTISLVWAVAVLLSLAWNLHVERQESTLDARDRLRAELRRDLTYFEAQPGATAGDWRAAAATMMRLLEQAGRRFGYRARIVGLPADPAAPPPDPWEQGSLELLAAGMNEVGSVVEMDGQECYRLMLLLRRLPPPSDAPPNAPGRVLAVTETVPLEQLEAAGGSTLPAVLLAHAVFLLVGLLGVRVNVARLSRRIAERETEARRRRDLEEKVAQIERLDAFGSIAGGVAHDFNNILTAILGSATLVQSRLPADDPLRRPVDLIVASTQRAAGLTNQMLACSGKGRVGVRPVDVNGVLGEMRTLVAALVSKKARIHYDPSAALPAVEADERQLRQLVIDLVTNASEALGEGGGEIRIRTSLRDMTAAELANTTVDDGRPAGRYVVLEVADTGCGMAPDVLEKLFMPFYTTKFTGRGLGLPAVLGIVRGHGGAIDVHSTPGKGTTVFVFLPASARPAERLAQTPPVAAPPPPSSSGPSRPRILVADDEECIRELTKALLEAAGFDVTTAPDGVAALEHLEGVDLALLDVTMPRMGGFETWREIRTRKPGTRVVLTSGYNETVAQQVLSEGAGGIFLRKPWSAERLVQTIRAALAGPPPA